MSYVDITKGPSCMILIQMILILHDSCVLYQHHFLDHKLDQFSCPVGARTDGFYPWNDLADKTHTHTFHTHQQCSTLSFAKLQTAFRNNNVGRNASGHSAITLLRIPDSYHAKTLKNHTPGTLCLKDSLVRK